MKITDILKLRQREELAPIQSDRIFHLPMNFQLPLVQRQVGLNAQIKNGEIMNAALAGRKPINGSNGRLVLTRHFTCPTFFASDVIVFHAIAICVALLNHLPQAAPDAG